MNMAFSSRTLYISQEEACLPVWQQLQSNRSLEWNGIEIRDSSTVESMNHMGDVSQDDYFSDESNDSSDEEDGEDLKLRQYQIELSEAAVSGRSCVICAPTGSGKTKVSVNIILKHLNETRGAKVAFFARTVPLAKQQYQTILKHLPRGYNVLLMTGESQDSMSLHKLLPQFDVVVVTPMILVNHLCGERPLLSDGIAVFSLLVFDECHHTREGEAYNNIMYYYLMEKKHGRKMPQVVGLTASIGVEKAQIDEDAKENIMKVCGNLDVDLVAIVKNNIAELQQIVPVPREYDVPLVKNGINETTLKILEIMVELERRAQHYALEGEDAKVSELLSVVPQFKDHPEYCQWTVHLFEAVKLVRVDDSRRETNMAFRNINIISQYLKAYHFALESIQLAQVRDVIRFLERCFKHFENNEERAVQEGRFYQMFEDLKEIVSRQEENVNLNLEILADTLRQHVVRKGNDTRAIVFVRTRMLADALSSWLCRCVEEDLRKLNARKFTSTNAPEELGGMSESQQRTVLDQFHSGQVRVLVATSVGEEGLDIPQCNLVVKYNHTGNEVSKVQTRGRSRAAGGVSILLGLPDILERERMNRIRVQLMEAALSEISEMEIGEFRQKVDQYQAELYMEWEIEELKRQQRRIRIRNVDFEVRCHLCKRVSVHSSKIRTIYEKYRVSIDRDLLDHIKIVPSEETSMDQLLFIGSAKCLGETESGKICNNNIGVVIKHKKCPFITLGIKNIVFYTGNESLTAKQWTKVPFLVEELSQEDLKEYAMEIFPPERE
ncbi:hypothetical protein EGW08_002891 [Elysia chlorotica]|uniref:RNA helicase n=1 Tax=Elysia chlorotica TaxID=188477 RepID=A0A3S1BR14_ELYCH|nr:hypothetical protein EGW08_002891 [Elysia chlorotica]